MTASSFPKSSPRSQKLHSVEERVGEDTERSSKKIPWLIFSFLFSTLCDLDQTLLADICAHCAFAMALATSNAKPGCVVTLNQKKGKERKSVGGSGLWRGLPKPPEIRQKRKIWIRKGTLSCAYYLWFTVPSTCHHPLLSSSSPFGNSQPMAFLGADNKAFFFIVIVSCHGGYFFPPPTLSQLSGFLQHYRFGLRLLSAKCCSLVLKSMIQLQQFYLGSAGAASASAHRLPMIQLQLLKCHWLLSCVFGFSLVLGNCQTQKIECLVFVSGSVAICVNMLCCQWYVLLWRVALYVDAVVPIDGLCALPRTVVLLPMYPDVDNG
ncbi:hypothetical protein Pelo_235 [Pelomyxa schiedti]|nr:hypothetical protein Pelo_235 [Pelomyxa schiedti]